MKNFIKVYYPIIIIVIFAMILGGFIERELIASRYDHYMETYDESYGGDSSMDTKSMIIYGNCQDCY
jgi:hypothetical protein